MFLKLRFKLFRNCKWIIIIVIQTQNTIKYAIFYLFKYIIQMMRCNDASNRQQQTDGRTNRQVNKIGDVGIKTKVNDHSTYSLFNHY